MSKIYTQQFLYSVKNQPYSKDLKNYTHTGSSDNVSCGDSIGLHLLVEEGTIKDLGYESDGCAVSAGAMSILADHIVGKSLRDAKKMSWEDFLNMLGVELTPAREKCAKVAYDVLVDAHEK